MAFINKAINADPLAFAEIFVGVIGIHGLYADTKFLPITAGVSNALVPFE